MIKLVAKVKLRKIIKVEIRKIPHTEILEEVDGGFCGYVVGKKIRRDLCSLAIKHVRRHLSCRLAFYKMASAAADLLAALDRNL